MYKKSSGRELNVPRGKWGPKYGIYVLHRNKQRKGFINFLFKNHWSRKFETYAKLS